MLDRQLFSPLAATTSAMLSERGVSPTQLASISDLVGARSQAIQQVEAARQAFRQATAAMRTSSDGAGGPSATARQTLKEQKVAISSQEERLTQIEQELEQIMLELPNLPDNEVPAGVDAQANVEVRRVGAIPTFPFTPLAHDTLGEQLGLLDFAAASKISGARFTLFRGSGAKLERALLTFMLDQAIAAGYQEIAPPLLVREQAMLVAGQYPKFRGEAFATQDGEYTLIPTSEVPLVNLHRDEIIPQSKLPVRYTAYTPCFRREAGAAGRDTRGLIRLHQFDKVELVAFAEPEESERELDRMTQHACKVLEALELPYRVLLLCKGDMGFAAAKTYDLEIWVPSQQCYREISSCSNCRDFQARRGQIRYREGGTGKPKLVHTLNGSAVAVGRAMVGILENHQQADGSIRLPKALHPYMGCERLSPLS